jgi:hypothetical protein
MAPGKRRNYAGCAGEGSRRLSVSSHVGNRVTDTIDYRALAELAKNRGHRKNREKVS